MATRTIPILTFATLPDTTGNAFFQELEVAIATTAANLHMLGFTMPDPGAADEGLYSSFPVPGEYVDTPKIVIRGILNGAPANTLAFGFQSTGGIAHSETADKAFGSQDGASNATWTGLVEEDLYEEVIDLTDTFSANEEVFYFFYRDGDVDDATFEFNLTRLLFRFNDV